MYDDCEAAQAIGAYAFAEADVHTVDTLLPATLRRRRWSYPIYDAQAPVGSELGFWDLVATVGISSRISEVALQGVLAALPEINRTIAGVTGATDFWGLDAAAIADPTNSMNDDVKSLATAINQLKSIPWIAQAIAHKILHRRFPRPVSLIDSGTAALLGGENLATWVVTHGELQVHQGQFEQLEGWFAAIARDRGERALLRLRMHDILVWLTVLNRRGERQREVAIAAGAELWPCK